LSGVPGREQAFRLAAEKAIAAAVVLGAKFVHLAPSRVSDGTSRDQCLEVYAANAEAALAMAEGRTVSLLLEPMNAVDAPTALFTRIDDAGAFLRDRFGGRVGLLFDLYHLTLGGTDLVGAAGRHHDLIRHVQFSDVPGRREPGTGHIDFGTAFAALEAAGYDGWFGAEYFPDRPTADTLGWLKSFQNAAESPLY